MALSLIRRALAGGLGAVGALNGAFYVQGDGSAGHLEELCQRWRDAAQHGPMRLNPELLPLALQGLARGRNPLLEVAKGLTSGLSLLNPQPVAELLDRWLDYPRISHASSRLTIALLPVAVV